jgi:hypothetical protein
MTVPGRYPGSASAVSIQLMENHDEAYRVWRRAGVRDRVLVHIDAHDDVVWAADEASINIASYNLPGVKGRHRQGVLLGHSRCNLENPQRY